MCKKLLCLMCFVVVLTLTGQVGATDYYVDSAGGDDGNPGTSPSQAWRTLTKVNNSSFAPGDKILFKYDSQWDGQLILSSSGAEGNPIIIDRYGGTSSKPRIDGNGTDGGVGLGGTVCLDDIEYIEVNNLEITNEAASRGSKRYGVLVNARDGDPWKVHIVLKNLYIHNVNGTLTKDTTGEGAGIQVECNAGTYIDGLIIEDCHLKTTDRNGIATHAPQWARPDEGCKNCVFRGNVIEDCGGDGIKLWGFFDALVEYNVVNGHHMRCTDAACGIWPFKSDRTVIQFNEVYGSIHTKDGQAFDIDDFTLDTTIQYNYSHDNVGGFLLVCALNTGGAVGGVVRYNISENDGDPAGRVFHLSGGGAQNTYIYNNTIYVGEGLSTPMILMQDWQGAPDSTHFYNNIFSVYGDVSYEWDASTNNILNNNVFYGNHTNPPTNPGQTPYDPNAITSDPMLVNPGSGGIGLGSVGGYQLQSGSPCINAGTDPGIAQDDPNYPNGGRDYWGIPLPANGPLLDIGFHEYPTEPDTTPPSPDPMTWSSLPEAVSDGSITMEATLAFDASNPVQYYFDCTWGSGHDSGWQTDTVYTDTGLNPNTTYTYTVKARDASPNQNETAVSTAESATTDPLDTTAPTPNPMTWATVPHSIGCTAIEMVATTASDSSGVEYYFDETTGNPGGTDSGWQDSPAYADTDLDEQTTYTYQVKARDMSLAQNETDFSTNKSATTGICGVPIPWSDDFEDGDISDWTVTAYQPGEPGYVNISSQGHPGKCAELRGFVWFEKALDTTGYTNIHVTFDGIQKGLDVTKGEAMTLEFYDGVNWILIGSVTETSWTSFDKSCGSGADDNPGFRIRFGLNSNHTAEWARIDNVVVTGTGGGPDTTPPSPNPMTWATAPYATGSTSIAMVATTATDPSGVEYLFDCTSGGGHDSGWQDGTSYTDTGLSPGTQYCYRVQARDKSANQNATGWSSTQCATTTQPDTTPPSPNPMTWATVPYATGSTSIAMVATTATDPSGVEYYFDETSGNPGGTDSGWQDGTSYTDTGLSSGTQYCYRVQARDKSPNQNATGWSSTECATTQTGGDTTPPSPNPMTWATVPYATGTTSIAMVATTATDPSGVEYFFDCTTTGGHDSGWQDGTSYTDTGLSPNTQYCYRVQARDKSPNQNATGWSSTECATTQSGGGTIFLDDFEDHDISDWTVTGNAASNSSAAYQSNYGVKFWKYGSMEKTISTVGYTDIQLEYDRRTIGYDAGEYFIVEWSDGSNWHTLESTADTSWGHPVWSLPAGAENNPDFKLRFTGNANQNQDIANLDNVELTGS